MTDGEWWTRFTAWLAFAAWFTSLALPREPVTGAPTRGPASILWLFGGLVMVVHVVLAFQVYHAWSHANAVTETAHQTRELTGIDWGGGVWLNYFFSFVWLGDAAWRLVAPRAHAIRPPWLAVLTHAFLAFIWFNATVVFGSWPMRVAGVLVFAALGWKRWRRR